MAHINTESKLTDRVFVFVVCGSAEHIDTVNFSIRQLKKCTAFSVVVVTELSRNEKDIEHDNVISVETSLSFNHHQASIFLKTSLHRILPNGKHYCYLDTDVVCLSKKVDTIFENFSTPITFAPDHCNITQFSPSAILCRCEEKEDERIKAEEADIKNKLESYRITDSYLLGKQERLLVMLQQIKKDRIRYFFTSLQFNLSRSVFQLTSDFFYDKKRSFWFDAQKNPIHYDSEQALSNLIEDQTGVYWEPVAERWNKRGDDIYALKGCNHLIEEIKTLFAIDISDRKWNHWNGGVFLFDDSSHMFMDAWHNKTLRIFTNNKWRTRDQGTLAATCWEFGLNNHRTLSKVFNFVADYNNPYLQISADKKYVSDDGLRTKYGPVLIHVFHHFGDRAWFLWQWVEQKMNEP